MDDHTEQALVTVGPQGRVVIPARIRRAANIERGSSLVVRVEDGRVVMERREDLLGRLRERFAEVPSGISLADELISERREEARRESRGR